MTRADFTGARLSGVRFTGCNLSQSQFSGATMKEVWFRDCTLLDIRHLPASVPRPPKLVHPHRSVYKIDASRFTRQLRSTAGERQASASFGSICTYPRATKNRSSR
ncbi:pentapeptide repeat-containing protein [Micromonospora sp. NPDC047134]|uniref:pentapeptide repeat-containing protein n=1 Tax=Micromonospora sp. NPDC047134 TaxID=3154340 RepID=UPI0033D5CDB9